MTMEHLVNINLATCSIAIVMNQRQQHFLEKPKP